MNMRALICSLCLALSLLSLACSAFAQQPPSIESVVAALNKQETASGASLDVVCTWGALTSPKAGDGRFEIRYVRTPRVLFMVETQGRYDSTGNWAAYETDRCVYNRATKEYRELGTAASGASIGARLSTNGGPNRFTSDPIPDVIFKPLLDKPLFQIIASGTVSKQQELVDGAMCWRVDIPQRRVDSNQGSSVAWSIWLDPQIDLCPRKIAEKYGRDGTASNTITQVFADYKSFEGGVRLPMSQTVYFDDTLTDGSRIEVKKVTVGKQIPDSELSVEFPKGTRILMLPEGNYVTVP